MAEPEGATGWPPTGRIPEHRANEAAWLQQGTEPDGGVDAPADVAPEAPPHWADEPTVPLVTVEATGAPSVSTSTGEATTGATLAAGNTTTATLERPAADETPPRGGTRSRMRNTIEWVVIIGAALIAAIVIKTFLIQAFYIPSASMEHTLNIQDRVLVNKLSYRLHDVHRGDIVVFERPPNDVGQIRDLIKRVVGLSGETVEGHDGSVYVNGRQLREPYLEQGITTADFSPQRIPDGYVWVMGDNRGNSSDSRVFGAIEESSIVGRAFVRVWPLSAVGLL